MPPARVRLAGFRGAETSLSLTQAIYSNGQVWRNIPLAIQYDKKAPATQDHYGKWYGVRRTCRTVHVAPNYILPRLRTTLL